MVRSSCGITIGGSGDCEDGRRGGGGGDGGGGGIGGGCDTRK
ncbi:unnamed protein product, partial [Rotaria sordida]